MKKFGKVLKKKLKQLVVTKNLNMENIFKKLGLNLMMICHWIKPIKLLLLTIINRFVFSENSNFYPQLLLDDALFELV